MSTLDIDQMLAEKGNLCISILVSTHRFSKERIQNSKTLEKAIAKAKALLQHSTWPPDKILLLDKKIDAILEKIDFIRLQEGLGIFISLNISRIIPLPFPVEEKIVLGKNFEMRDLLYFAQFLKQYYLLAVSKKRIRLFKGEGRDIQEISNNDFPKQYVDTYVYARPSLGSSSSTGLKEFERDKSILKETRQKAFLKEIDNTMDKYLKSDVPLLVAGVEEELANFQHVTHHLNHVVGTINGNYDHDAVHPLSEVSWKKMNEFIRTSQKELLIELREGIGKGLTVDSIGNVWKMATEGNGLTLFVEKDYKVKGYLDPANDSKIYLTPPAGKYDIITDAVERLLEIVKEKGGNIVIVENGELEDFSHIALLLRYAS